MPIKILSLNLWSQEGPWPERAKAVGTWLDRLDPDLVGFQEVIKGPGVDGLQEILKGRGYQVEFVAAGPYGEDGSLEIGNAVASRWPIRDCETLELPNGGQRDRCVALSITTESPLGPISFTTTHLMYAWYMGWVRELQVQALADLVVRRCPKGGFPAIICGDFNARPESSEIRFLKGLQSLEGKSCYLLDCWEQGGDGSDGATVANRNPYSQLPGNLDLRVDYIFAATPWPGAPGRVESCSVVCDEDVSGVFPSDHFGVYTQLASS